MLIGLVKELEVLAATLVDRDSQLAAGDRLVEYCNTLVLPMVNPVAKKRSDLSLLLSVGVLNKQPLGGSGTMETTRLSSDQPRKPRSFFTRCPKCSLIEDGVGPGDGSADGLLARFGMLATDHSVLAANEKLVLRETFYWTSIFFTG